VREGISRHVDDLAGVAVDSITGCPGETALHRPAFQPFREKSRDCQVSGLEFLHPIADRQDFSCAVGQGDEAIGNLHTARDDGIIVIIQ